MSAADPSSSGGSGAERRRYTRLPISLEATISIQGRKPLPCVVRDFCAAGVFVALAPEYLHDLTKHTKAMLHFSMPLNDVPQFYDLGLVVYRVVGNGIGCGFSDPDPNSVRVLKKFANESNQGVQLTDEALAETQSGFRPDFLRVKDDLINLCVQRTEALVQDFIRVADEALFLSARDAINNQEETLFLDGQNEFRRLGKELESNVPMLAKQAVQIINSPLGADASNSRNDDTGELQLIDKDDFEEFLTVSELVSELEPKFKAPLFELERRFQYLAKREVDEHSNPIGPEVLCNLFAETIKTMESDRQAVNKVYAALKKVLDSGLGRYYDEVNKFFVNHNVLRIIEKEKPKFKKTTPTPKPPSAAAPGLDETQSGLGSSADLSATFGTGNFPQAGSYAAPSGGGAAAPSGGTAAPAAAPASAPPLAPLDEGLEPPGSGQVP